MLMREWVTPRTKAGDCTYSFINLGAGVLTDVLAEFLGALVARELLACLFSVDWWRLSVRAHGVLLTAAAGLITYSLSCLPQLWGHHLLCTGSSQLHRRHRRRGRGACGF